METNGTSNSISSKSDYQRVLRPTSIVLKESGVVCVSPETKGILNWKFPSISDDRDDDDHLKSYLNFDDFNYESFDEVSRLHRPFLFPKT